MLLLSIGLLSPTGASAREASASEADLIQRLLPAVVNIYVRGPALGSENAVSGSDDLQGAPLKSAYGSGFVIEPDGLIATNRHVIAGATQLIVGFSDGSRALGTVVASAGKVDFALIKVDASHKLPALTLGDSDRMRVGDPVLAIGNPLHLGISVSAGIVSGLNRNINETPFDSFMQTDAAINHGNSGGPLVNMQGEVIGINSAIFSESDTSGSIGLGFALTSNDMKFLIDRLRRYGRVRAGWIGVGLQDMNPSLAEILGDPTLTGAIVTTVARGGPAEAAGLRVGDVIERIGDMTPSDARGAMRDVGISPVGEKTSLHIWRNGAKLAIDVTVEELPGTPPSAAVIPVVNQFVTGGLELAPIDDEARHKYNLGTGQTGVLVAAVANNVFTGEQSLLPGDVILRVQDAEVKTPDDFHRRIQEAVAGGHEFVALLVKSKEGQTWMPLAVKDVRAAR